MMEMGAMRIPRTRVTGLRLQRRRRTLTCAMTVRLARKTAAGMDLIWPA